MSPSIDSGLDRDEWIYLGGTLAGLLGVLLLGTSLGLSLGLTIMQNAAIAEGAIPTFATPIGLRGNELWQAAKQLQLLGNASAVLAAVLLFAYGVAWWVQEGRGSADEGDAESQESKNGGDGGPGRPKKGELSEQILELLKNTEHRAMTLGMIVDSVDGSRRTVHDRLGDLADENKIQHEKIGNARAYWHAGRNVEVVKEVTEA